MTRFLADEDFDGRIVRGLIRRSPALDVLRVQDVNLASAHDAQVLAYAAEENRVLLTHDVTTMTAHAYRRIAEGMPMPGIFAVPQDVSVGEAIANLLLIAEYGLEGEWEGQVRFLPLK